MRSDAEVELAVVPVVGLGLLTTTLVIVIANNVRYCPRAPRAFVIVLAYIVTGPMSVIAPAGRVSAR